MRSQHSTSKPLPVQFLICKGQLQNPLISLKWEDLGFSQEHVGDFLTPTHHTPTATYKKKVLPRWFHSEREGPCFYRRCKNVERDLSVWERKIQAGKQKLPGSLSFLSKTQSCDTALQFTPSARISLMLQLVTLQGGFVAQRVCKSLNFTEWQYKCKS